MLVYCFQYFIIYLYRVMPTQGYIFKFFHVEYVRRLSYNELPTSPKWGMRYVIAFSF